MASMRLTGSDVARTNSITFTALLLHRERCRRRRHQPIDFAFSPDNRRIYVADARPFTATNSDFSGGIQCWGFQCRRRLQYWYTLQPVPGLTNGAQTITADFSANPSWGTTFSARIYMSHLRPHHQQPREDHGQRPRIDPTVLATAGTNEAFAGCVSARRQSRLHCHRPAKPNQYRRQ